MPVKKYQGGLEVFGVTVCLGTPIATTIGAVVAIEQDSNEKCFQDLNALLEAVDMEQSEQKPVYLETKLRINELIKEINIVFR